MSDRSKSVEEYDRNYNKGYHDGYAGIPYDDLLGENALGYLDGYKDGYANYRIDNGFDDQRQSSYGKTGSRKSSSSATNKNSSSSKQPRSRKSSDKSPKNKKAKDKRNKNKMNKKTKNKKNRKKRFSFKKLILIIILIAAVLFGLVSALILRYIGMMNLVETKERVSSSGLISSKNVENILIIGSDARTSDSGSRSDSMILLSINKETKKLIQTSFMRDMWVEVPGYGENKLNAAYAYGGAELLMDTIEQNFNIEINNYIEIDFFSFIDIIDSLGGLDITITTEEAKGMTDPLGEQNKYLGNEKGTDYLKKGGTIHMNGNQALAYARLRYVGNADYQRTERQRIVLNKIMDKIKDASVFEINTMLKTVLPQITSNMNKTQLYFLALRSPFILGYERQELRIPKGDPGDGYFTNGTSNDGQSILVVDFDKNTELLRKTIYGY